jgi:hypothetical protein
VASNPFRCIERYHYHHLRSHPWSPLIIQLQCHQFQETTHNDKNCKLYILLLLLLLLCLTTLHYTSLSFLKRTCFFHHLHVLSKSITKHFPILPNYPPILHDSACVTGIHHVHLVTVAALHVLHAHSHP